MAHSGIARGLMVRCITLLLLAGMVLGGLVQPASGSARAGVFPGQTLPPSRPAHVTHSRTEQRESSYRVLPPGLLQAGAGSIQPLDVSGTLMTEGFESAFPSAGWQVLNRQSDGSGPFWGKTNAKKKTGTSSAWPARDGNGGLDPAMFGYPDSLDSWMIYGPVNFTGVSSGVLQFAYTNQSESGKDYFGWYASVDGTNFYGTQVSGDSGEDFVAGSFDLTAVPTLGNLDGQASVWIAFAFTSDAANADFYEGAFVDDVVLSGRLASGTNLLPVTPEGWDRPVVPSSESGTTTAGTLYALQKTFIDWAVLNEGDAVTTPFRVCLTLDATQLNSFPINALDAGQTYTLLDYLPAVNIAAETHTLTLTVDCTHAIAETNEDDNSFSYDFTWDMPPRPNLLPATLPNWTYPVVPSNTANNTTLRPLNSANSTYINWVFRNTGSEITTSFGVNFYIDDVLIPEASTTINLSSDVTMAHGEYLILKNRLLNTSPAPGTHTLKLSVDPANTVDELYEDDNTWEGEFTWTGSCVSAAVSAEPENGGTARIVTAPNCPDGKFIKDSVILLEATPAASFAFTEWTGTGSSTTNPYSVKLSADSSAFTAHFVPCYTLTLTADPPEGGQVTGQPAPNCGSQYKTGTRVDLTATANPGYGITQWSGPVEQDQQGLFVVMDGEKAVTVSFMAVPAVPALLTPANQSSVASLKPVFTWKSSGTDARYELDLALNQEFTDAVRIEDIPAPTYTPADALQPVTTYYWRVRAVNSGGLYSNWSAARWFKTLGDAPALVSPEDGAALRTLRPELAWEPLDGASSYTLQLSTSPIFSSVFFTKTLKSTSYEYTTDLRYRETPIYWRVRGVMGRRVSSWSDTWHFTTPNPPGIPVPLKPAGGSLTTNPTPLLDWSDVTAPAGLPLKDYWVQLSTAADFSEKPVDEYTGLTSSLQIEDTLPSNTLWYWRVRSVNTQDQMSAWSRVFTFRTALLPPVLDWPADGEQLKNNRPVFGWPVILGASTYTLQISTSPDFKPLLVSKTSRLSPGPQLTADLRANTTYYWHARSNGANGPSLWSPARSFTTGNPPSAPALLLPGPNALLLEDVPTFSWKAATFPTGTTLKQYEIQIDVDPAFSGPISDTTPGTEYTLRVYALLRNTRYYWRVRAYNQADEYSNWSAVRTVRIAYERPTLTAPDNGAEMILSRPVFEWAPVPGASGYTIQVSTSEEFATLKTSASFSARNKWTCNKVLPPGTYFWRMRANGSFGPGIWSAVRTLTILAP